MASTATADDARANDGATTEATIAMKRHRATDDDDGTKRRRADADDDAVHAVTADDADATADEASARPRAGVDGERRDDDDAGDADGGGGGGGDATDARTNDDDDDDAVTLRAAVGEDPAVTAARNAARRGPSAEDVEAARANAERERLELERENEIVTRSLECPQSMVGRIIGRGGETIKSLQATSGAHVAIDQSGAEGEPKRVTISGTRKSVDAASELVENLLLGTGAMGGMLVIPGQITRSIECPKERVGKIIGRGGETIRGIQAATGARLQIDQTRQPCVVMMAGAEACVDACTQVVNEILEGGSTAVFNEIARGGQGFGYASSANAAPYASAGWTQTASTAYAQQDVAAYAQQQAMYAQMYAAYSAQSQPQISKEQYEAIARNPWRALDDGKGNTYYYNALTGVSQWDKPDDFKA